jgi:hypothetical protein
MTDLRNIVFANLNFAAENGYFEKGEHLDGASPEEITDDMICYADNLVDYTQEQILPHVKEWVELRQVIGRVMRCR